MVQAALQALVKRLLLLLPIQTYSRRFLQHPSTPSIGAYHHPVKETYKRISLQSIYLYQDGTVHIPFLPQPLHTEHYSSTIRSVFCQNNTLSLM